MSIPPDGAPPRSWWRATAQAVGIGIAGVLVVRSFVGGTTGPLATIVALVIVLGGGTAIAWRAGRHERRYDLVGIFATGIALRAVGMLARLEGAVDGREYHRHGLRLAEEFRALDFDVEVGRPIPGTGVIRIVAGLIDSLAGDAILIPFAVFTVLSALGMVLLHRAFAEAVPEGAHHRYAILLAVWPTLWFWPSSLGKEAWMLAAIGLCALGAVRLLGARWLNGAALLAGGLLGCGLVRPHVGLIVLAGLGAAVVGRSGGQTGSRLAGRVVAVVGVLIGGALLAGATADRFQVDSLGTEQVDETLALTEEKTSQGGSGFSPTVVRTPVDLPVGAVTVLLRPFPGEVRDATGLATSAETVLLLGLIVVWRRPAWHLLRAMRARPYALFALVYTTAFVWAFSNIANFGILARQRSQVIPFVLLFLAGPAVAVARRSRDAPTRASRPPADTDRPLALPPRLHR